MISIVTAYYNRKKLFINTLESIKKQLNNSVSLEVIAVDDASDENERLEDLTVEYPFLKIIRLEKQHKWYLNACIPFNIGFKEAKGDIIIFQNPECLHFGNIIEYTIKNLNSKNYLSFGCYSIDEHVTDNISILLDTPNEINNIIQENNVANNFSDGSNCWYNHSTIRPVGYHFCAAISRDNLYDLGGFDERYALGVAYDDDELLHRIKLKLKLKIVDKEIVLHQYHYNKKAELNNDKVLDEKQKKIS